MVNNILFLHAENVHKELKATYFFVLQYSMLI